MVHSRKNLRDTVTGILLITCALAEAMPSRLVMKHMLLVSILHCTVRIKVSTYFLEPW